MTKTWDDPHAKREAGKYSNPIPSREFIMQYLGELAAPVSYRQLLNKLELSSEDHKEALRRRLRAMRRDGQLIEIKRGLYQLTNKVDLIRGHVQANRDGHGFLIPSDGSKDLFLPARQMRKVLDGDIVLARLAYFDRRRGRGEAAIVEVIERAHQQIVGRYFRESGIGFVEPTNNRITQNIVIPEKENLNAKNGEVVVAEMMAYPTAKTGFVGKIVEILGDHMAPGMEVDVAVRAYNLPHRWPKAVMAAVSGLKKQVEEKDKKGRVDLRNLPLVTIDGEDAKDFDDAVYCEKRRLGAWRLYVAIADVSHYVKPNTVLDQEAQQRGNSVYFPGEVIPMLPKILSNGLCSLNPKVDRLCMVCEMNIDTSGRIKRYKFYPAVMKSKARLSYTEVGNFLEGKATNIDESLHQHLNNLHKLYQLLYKQRMAAGAISFETTEVKVEFGKGRKIKRLYPVVRNDAHKLIEECMLRANIAAARFLLKHKCPALYRIHAGPKEERLEDLHAFLNELGLHLGGKNSPEPKDYAQVLKQAEGRPDQHLIQTMLLRSMSQAFYTSDNGRHFGLAFDEYTHFTSPIRRYPDLLVHRAINAVLNKQKKNLVQNGELERLGEHCSATERRADEATRDALSWLKCEYMLNKVGEEFKGVVSGVTSFGIFVELESIYVEGLVHVNSLKGDFYRFDAVRQRLIAQRSGVAYRLGDQVAVKVLRVDLDNKQIDFALLELAKKVKKVKKSRSK